MISTKTLCSVTPELAPLLVQWVADTDGKSRSTERPDWRQKAHDPVSIFTPCCGKPYWL
ncbi:hypothetical protein ACLK1S_18775 [Escherichia coli]